MAPFFALRRYNLAAAHNNKSAQSVDRRLTSKRFARKFLH
jgi:hypothetical protein